MNVTEKIVHLRKTGWEWQFQSTCRNGTFDVWKNTRYEVSNKSTSEAYKYQHSKEVEAYNEAVGECIEHLGLEWTDDSTERQMGGILALELLKKFKRVP